MTQGIGCDEMCCAVERGGLGERERRPADDRHTGRLSKERRGSGFAGVSLRPTRNALLDRPRGGGHVLRQHPDSDRDVGPRPAVHHPHLHGVGGHGGQLAQQAPSSGCHPTDDRRPGPPPAWHEDPDGSGRLRYHDGTHWTDHYSDDAQQPEEPGTEGDEEEVTVVLKSQSAGRAEAPCSSCGQSMSPTARFCPTCGTAQATA